MPYYHCHDCYKVIHVDDDYMDACPLCASKNGVVLTDEVHHQEVEEGYLFHEDTD